MKTQVITAISISALLIATMPVTAADTISSTMPKMISRGQRLTPDETMRYEAKAKASERSIGRDAGGAEAGAGTLILAVIGGLAVLGVLLAANEQKQ